MSTDEIRLAAETEGFFAEEEGLLLRTTVLEAPPSAEILEVGSYKGRSSRFILSAMTPTQRLTCVDSFRVAASYRGHSYSHLKDTLDDPRVSVLPMALRTAYGHLRIHGFDVTLVDADHSFVGASEDISLAVALSRINAALLCHDMDEELFPGVVAAAKALVERGVLHEEIRVGTLVRFRVMRRPTWLVDPGVYRDQDLPSS